MAIIRNERIAVVFNGFLALSMKERVELVDVLNEFFDYPDKRASMREENEKSVKDLVELGTSGPCPSCRRVFSRQ